MPMRCAALQVLHIAADGASLDEVRALRLVVPRVSTRSTPCEYSQYGVRSLLAPLVSARSTPRVHTPGVPTCGRQREYSGYPVSTRSTLRQALALLDATPPPDGAHRTVVLHDALTACARRRVLCASAPARVRAYGLVGLWFYWFMGLRI
jgi:hypothetical protein